MNIVFHYDAGPRLLAKLHELEGDGIAVNVCPVENRGDFSRLMGRADVLWHVLEPVTDEIIRGASSLRLIQKFGVGVNTIDLDAARANDIAVCNLPGTNSRAVAELTLALMLAALRRIPAFDGLTRAGRGWNWDPALQDSLGEVHGKVIGLVGYGAVPEILAPILKAMGAEIIYFARTERPGAAGRFAPLETVLTGSDIVSLHVPLSEQTAGMIDRSALSRMKPGAILINTARGGLIDQVALADALKSGRLAAAGLDTFAVEPVAAGDPLFSLDNLVCTPHIAWLTPETIDRSLLVAVENVRRLAAGRTLLHRVI